MPLRDIALIVSLLLSGCGLQSPSDDVSPSPEEGWQFAPTPASGAASSKASSTAKAAPRLPLRQRPQRPAPLESVVVEVGEQQRRPLPTVAPAQPAPMSAMEELRVAGRRMASLADAVCACTSLTCFEHHEASLTVLQRALEGLAVRLPATPEAAAASRQLAAATARLEACARALKAGKPSRRIEPSPPVSPPGPSPPDVTSGEVPPQPVTTGQTPVSPALPDLSWPLPNLSERQVLNAVKLYRRGLRLARQGDVDGALDAYQRAVAADPRSHARFKAAEVLLAQGDTIGALGLLSQYRKAALQGCGFCRYELWDAKRDADFEALSDEPAFEALTDGLRRPRVPYREESYHLLRNVAATGLGAAVVAARGQPLKTRITMVDDTDGKTRVARRERVVSSLTGLKSWFVTELKKRSPITARKTRLYYPGAEVAPRCAGRCCTFPTSTCADTQDPSRRFASLRRVCWWPHEDRERARLDEVDFELCVRR